MSKNDSKSSSYMPIFYGVLTGLAALNAWYLSALAVNEQIIPTHYQWIMDFVFPALCAVVGASAAFFFNHGHERRQRHQSHAEGMNNILVYLALQLNVLGNIRRVLNQYPHKDLRTFNMPAFKNFNADVKFGVHGIIPALPRHPNLVLRLSIEQDGFFQTIESLNSRHRFYLDELQPAMNELGLVDRVLNSREFYEKLPTPILRGALKADELLMSNMADSEMGLEAVFKELREVAIRTFPRHTFFNLA